MQKALRTRDLFAAEVWAYTPPQETEGEFVGKRQHSKGEQEKRHSRRLELFSRFDEGIELDDDMWWSVTPEQLAMHTAERCSCDLLLDGFAGAGGNAIAFARSCGFVLACEIDKARIGLAKANAAVYGGAYMLFGIGSYQQQHSSLPRSVQGVMWPPVWISSLETLQRSPRASSARASLIGTSALRCDSPSASPHALLLSCKSCILFVTNGNVSVNQQCSCRASDKAESHEDAQIFCDLPRAFYRPRTVPLLPMLREAVLFSLRDEKERKKALSSEDPNQEAATSVAEVRAANATADDQESGEGGKSALRHPAKPWLHIELAVSRSRRDAGSVSFDRLESYGDLVHLASGLRRVFSKAPISKLLVDPVDSCDLVPSAGLVEEKGELESSAKRRRTAKSGKGVPELCEASHPPKAHDRRWQAEEAAKEEFELFGERSQLGTCGVLVDAVAERWKVYKELDSSPTEWRWLPVDLLWGAAPLTRGSISDPFARLSRLVLAAKKNEEQEEEQQQQEQEGPCCWLYNDVDDGGLRAPLMKELQASPVPCICREISSWRWRAVGLMAFFGASSEKRDTTQGDLCADAKKPSTLFANTEASGTSTKLAAGKESVNGDIVHEEVQRKMRRRALKAELQTLLQDALHLSGLMDPDAVVLGQRSQPLTLKSESALVPSAGAHPHSKNTATEVYVSPEELKSKPSPDTERTRVVCETPNIQQSSHAISASSLACFARQTVESCSSSNGRVCNCFYSQKNAEWRQQPRRGLLPPESSHASSPNNGDNTAICTAIPRSEWRTFERRLIATGSRKLSKARENCSCSRCSNKGASEDSYDDRAKTRCTWKSALWSECEKLVHIYLTAACSCTTTLRLAVRPPIGKKKRRKRAQKVPLFAEPLQPDARAQFLKRVGDAYASACWGHEAAVTAYATDQTDTRNMFEGTPQTSDIPAGDAQSSNRAIGDSQAALLWTPEEVLHWQFSCSMWCNSALRLLVAQRDYKGKRLVAVDSPGEDIEPEEFDDDGAKETTEGEKPKLVGSQQTELATFVKVCVLVVTFFGANIMQQHVFIGA
ncbi:hypothetical protein cyc_08091 [Cyclospora cayetanensis]|uniref:Trimethylguanosine synthase n=1 Tax=Cyclospora cayetanensis TaxID=88456 RepID=A0A1D3CUK9_9EIME|nr:hypothetical protein cyc_08091 [Cyclospora cayetanensis]